MKLIKFCLIILLCITSQIFSKNIETQINKQNKSLVALLNEFDKKVEQLKPFLHKIGSNIKHINSCLGQLEKEAALAPINIEEVPQWVEVVCLTSPGIKIKKENNTYFAHADCKSPFYFKIIPGDHNIWFPSEEAFWGYNVERKLFNYNLTEPGLFLDR